ncbi:hypothetical protein [Polynucleobacter sp. MWH-UH2A]|uniref:hypothetical protein n=1 Tax=Polynucleobacter sp. MWH-UH2A TaxID=1855617 RepID=UPI001BFE4928|nr:hypothetical protein [Polynucleobacter sp. MWH-UH2A]QWD63394.1 hypothetical protein IC571_06745 [Polynucleobacter sp. MWH-UH2A]
MKIALVIGLLTLLLACSSSPRYSNNSYTQTYKPQASSTYSKPVAQSNYQANNAQGNYIKTSGQSAGQSASPVAVSNFERLSYEDLVRFEPDCERRTEQAALLEEQLRRNRFYTVDGVDGNSYPGKISKSYYSLIKYRIWSLHFSCQGSEVARNVIEQDIRAVPTSSPLATPRCYFEETTEAKTSVQPAHYLTSEQQSTRREICTNFPYAQDKPFIRVGDQISLSSRDAKDGTSYSALRKWRGNIYQMVSKTEMHLNQAVRFTLVTVRSGVNQWTVVDKF